MGLTDRLAFLVSAEGVSVAAGELGKIGTAVKKAAADTEASAGSFNVLGLSSTAMGAAVVAGTAAAGLAVLKFTETGIKKFVDLTDNVRRFQATSGATAEDSSKLLYAAQALGVPIDSLSTMIYRLGANVELAPQKFAQFNVAIAKTKDGSTDLLGTFNNVIQKMNELGQGSAADALAKTLVGRGAQTLAPLAQQYDELIRLEAEAKRSGAVVDQAQVDEGLRYKEAIHQLGTEFGALERSLAGNLIPLLTGVAGALGEGVRGVSSMFNAVGGLIGHLGSWASGSTDVANALTELAGKSNLSTSEIAKQAQAEQEAAAAADKYAQAVKGARDALVGEVDADKAVADAKLKVQQAGLLAEQQLKDEATARLNLSDALVAETDANRALADAEAAAAEKPERDLLAQRSAHFAVADAIKAHAQAVVQYGANSEEAAKAADALETARLNEGDAARKAAQPDTSVQHAQDALAAAKQHASDAQDALNKAEAQDPAQALADAEANLAKAVAARADAQYKGNKAITDGTVNTADLKASFDSLIADMVAAGVDPKTVAVYTKIEADALAARKVVDDLHTAQNGGAPAALPPLNALDVGQGVPDQQITAKGQPRSQNVPAPTPPATGPYPTSDQQAAGATVNYNTTVNVQTNADPAQIGAAVVFAQTTRR